MPRTLAFIVHPGFELLDLSGPCSAFHLAREQFGADYRIRVMSVTGGPVVDRAGVSIASDPFDAVGPCHTVLAAGGPTAHQFALDPTARALVRRSAPGCRLVLCGRDPPPALLALDQAYGLQPEAHTWIEMPETFEARLELLSRVEMAPALLFGARRLLLQMCGWLAARHSGVSAFTLQWAHDAMRSRSAGEGGELCIRTAEPSRNLEHLCRLLAEHLAKLVLQAPVGELRLVATEIVTLDETSASLLPDPANDGESLQLVLERIAARIGPEHVLRPVLTDDHRLEWMQMWQPVPMPRPRKAAEPLNMPQPTWVLPTPLKLATRGHRPLYQGVLHLLTGPHRVEGGWWHRLGEGCDATTGHVQRDYWVALSEHAGVLWIYQERLASEETAWYLHGVFA